MADIKDYLISCKCLYQNSSAYLISTGKIKVAIYPQKRNLNQGGQLCETHFDPGHCNTFAMVPIRRIRDTTDYDKFHDLPLG